MKAIKKKSLTKFVMIWIISSLSIIAIITVAANLYISEKHAVNSEQMAEQLQILVDVQKLNNSFSQLVSDFRGYLAFGRQEFYNLSLKERLNFDQEFTEFSLKHVAQDRFELELEDNSQSITIIRKLWTQYADLIETAFILKQNNDQLLADELSKSQTTPVINEILEEFTIVTARQQRNVNLIMEENRSFNRLLLYLLFGFTLGLALLGFFLFLFIRGSVINPIKKVEQHVDLISQGEYIAIPSSGRQDEIGQLEIGINEMARQLKLRLESIEQSRQELTEQRDELEAQNEEILAQQEEQAYTLHALKQRELELELINSFQEKLMGHMELEGFLSLTLGQMLEILQQDAVLVIVKAKDASDTYRMLYSEGYPNHDHDTINISDLYGMAIRAIESGRPYFHPRILSGNEQGLHGAYMHAVDQYYPLFDDQRNVIGLLLLTRYGTDEISVNDQRKAKGLVQQFSLALYSKITSQEHKEQRDLIRQIIESIYEGMLMCDHNGRIILANGRLNSMLEMDIQEGMNTGDLLKQLQHRADFSNFAPIINDIRAALSDQHLDKHIRFAYTMNNGKILNYDLYLNIITSLQDGKEGYLFVFRDRTEEEKVDELKNEFISIVSHELRTPLSSILGFIEILLHRDITVDKQKNYLETVFKEATRLSHLITDFLDLQRIEAGKQLYQFNPVNLNVLIQDLAERYNSSSSDHQVHVHAEIGNPNEYLVTGDYDRLTQVFDNLISNAMKYSPGKERIDLIMSNVDDAINIEIKDYGLGIPDSAREKLFTKFYRVDNSDRRKIGGTGLGLAIVKEIVEAHQGEISYESVLGEGSTFTIRLKRIVNDSDNK